MYPRKVVQATETKADSEVHSGPAIVMDSKEVTHSDPTTKLKDKIASHLTIGNHSFDEKLTIYGEK